MMRSDFKFWAVDWHVVGLIMGQSLRSVALGMGAYIAWGLGMAGVLLMLRSTLGSIRTGYATVVFEPMVGPLIGMALLMGLFMAFLAGLSVARERELGTLETLFYGPIHYRDYILGKILGYWVAYVIVISVFLLACVWLGWATRLVFSPFLLVIALLSILVAVSWVGWGVLAAALMRSVRGTLLFLLGLIVLLLGLPFVASLLTSIASSQGFLNLIVLRDTLEVINNLVALVSPVSYLLNGTDAIIRESQPEFVGYLALAMFYGTATFILATWLLRRRGVVR